MLLKTQLIAFIIFGIDNRTNSCKTNKKQSSIIIFYSISHSNVELFFMFFSFERLFRIKILFFATILSNLC